MSLRLLADTVLKEAFFGLKCLEKLASFSIAQNPNIHPETNEILEEVLKSRN